MNDINKDFFDPKFPLLDKFRELAPGSYKHCQNVANICEAIGAELNLNTEILRCAALYHDIGKINNPKYFTENQDDDNVHDRLDPFISCQLITRHVGDGVIYLLKIPDMPSSVIEIVSQHHGDTIMQAFFNKSKNKTEDRFRYKCARPSSDEALILMIVDSVEATARSLSISEKPNNFIKTAINGTIERLVDDNQLNAMRVGTLKLTKKILIKELEGIYHKRVSYDKEEENNQTILDIKKESTSEKTEKEQI